MPEITHINYQDLWPRAEIINAGNAGSWLDFDDLNIIEMDTREHVYIENTGVNYDGDTANILFLRLLKEGDAKNGDPHIALKVGESWEANLASETNIAFFNATANSTFTLIQSQAIIRKGSRDYD